MAASSVTSPHSQLLSNFNNFFKDFPVKMLWPDQFSWGWGQACFILKDIYRLASHKKDLAQILSCVALGNLRPDNQYWSGMILQPSASHKSQEGGECLPGPHHKARKVTGIRRGPPGMKVTSTLLMNTFVSHFAVEPIPCNIYCLTTEPLTTTVEIKNF